MLGGALVEWMFPPPMNGSSVNKNPHRHRRYRSAIGLSLLIAVGAACGSDNKSETTDAPSEASSAVSSAVSSAGSAAETTDVPTDTEISVVAATASDDREAIIEFVVNNAVALGIEFDLQCVADLVAQLSDEDAKLVADSARAGGEGDPQLSAEGEAIGDQLETCVTFDPTATTG